MFSVLLVLPLIIDVIHFNRLGSKFLLESSVFGFDYGRFFSHFAYDKSVFMLGTGTIGTLVYSFLYGILYLLQRVFTPLDSFFFFLIAAVITSYYFFVKLFNELIEVVDAKNDGRFYFLLSCILGLVFFTSLSNFFLSGSITFLLSTLVLIAQLFFVKRYAVDDEKRGLIFFALLNCFALFNVTIFLINIFFTNVFFYILFHIRHKIFSVKTILKKPF